jgi:hypothetical protein
MANAAQVLLLKQKAEPIDAAASRFRLTTDERQLLLGADKGEGLLLVRGNRIPLQIVASKAEYRLATTNPRDLEQLAFAVAKEERVPPPASSDATAPGSVGAILGARRAGRVRAPTPNGRADHASPD